MQALMSAESHAEMLTARPPLPPARMGLVESVAQQILALIAEKHLKPGDRLPSTRMLAQRFQVATPTIREVLRRLQATGVVDIRHGSGIYVRKGHLRMMLANPNVGMLDPRATIDLLNARLLVEPPLAELAAQIIDENGIAALRGILAEAEQYLVGNDQMLHTVNMSFHLAIARCTGNIALAQIMESLIELYSFEQFAVISLFNARFQDHEEHKAICAAICEPAPARARCLMEQHIIHVISVVETRLRKRMEDEGERDIQEKLQW
jgi:GntR family transcriptional regulator, transcriptional repressor for pyruvate dehydrogenase complex